MEIKIPICPKCHGNVILAPIPQSVEIAKIKCGDLPVSCYNCSWRGTWKEVPYSAV
jgi:hypothetical protein